jgi:hypothetical protein
MKRREPGCYRGISFRGFGNLLDLCLGLVAACTAQEHAFLKNTHSNRTTAIKELIPRTCNLWFGTHGLSEHCQRFAARDGLPELSFQRSFASWKRSAVCVRRSTAERDGMSHSLSRSQGNRQMRGWATHRWCTKGPVVKVRFFQQIVVGGTAERQNDLGGATPNEHNWQLFSAFIPAGFIRRESGEGGRANPAGIRVVVLAANLKQTSSSGACIHHPCFRREQF